MSIRPPDCPIQSTSSARITTANCRVTPRASAAGTVVRTAGPSCTRQRPAIPDASATGTALNRTFTDLTFDMQNDPLASWCSLGDAVQQANGVAPGFTCLWAPGGIHPDQHAIVVNPSNPTQIFEGSDGGVIRTDGTFGDLSSRCNSNERGLLSPPSLANCGRMLSRVPTTITHINRNYNTLQFINVAINPGNPSEVQGGTQDNGTWSNNNPSGDRNNWPQVIYGDGGNAGYDGTNPTWRFNEFTSAFTDANFENGDPTKWVIISAPLVNSGEAVGFYWPEVADPNPPTGAHPIFSGLQHVWRSWAFGAGDPSPFPQDTTPNISFYENNCQEFTVFGGQPGCGDFQPMGGDLTSSTYGDDRAGGAVSWIARNKADHGTLWATTSAGRVFVTHNADASNPANVVWHRIDSSTSGNSPTRYPELDLSGPDQRESCVRHLLRLQRSDADHSWSRLRRARRRYDPGLGFVHESPGRTRHGDIPDADRQRRSAGQRYRPRRREEKVVRRHGLRRRSG